MGGGGGRGQGGGRGGEGRRGLRGRLVIRGKARDLKKMIFDKPPALTVVMCTNSDFSGSYKSLSGTVIAVYRKAGLDIFPSL